MQQPCSTGRKKQEASECNTLVSQTMEVFSKSYSYRDSLGGKPTFVTCTFSSVSDDGAAQKQRNVAPQTFPLSGTPANHFASMDTNATPLCHSKGQMTEPNNNLESANLCAQCGGRLKKGPGSIWVRTAMSCRKGLGQGFIFSSFFWFTMTFQALCQLDWLGSKESGWWHQWI